MDSESNILLKIINESKIVNFEIINKNKSKCIEEFHNSKIQDIIIPDNFVFLIRLS